MSPGRVYDGDEGGEGGDELEGGHRLPHVVRVDPGQGRDHQRDHVGRTLEVKRTRINQTPEILIQLTLFVFFSKTKPYLGLDLLTL